ncbi:MAG: exosortase-associated EpsI family protein [Thermoguttaceae bacterium]
MTIDNLPVNEAEIESVRLDEVYDESEKKKKHDRLMLIIGVIIVLAISIPSTILAELNWGHWGTFTKKMQLAGDSLSEIPRELENWEALEDDEKLDQASVEMLELSNYIVRRYVNKSTGEKVSMIMMVGPTGRIAVHTPVVCFGGRNYEIDPAGPVPVTFNIAGTDEKNVMRKAVFRNKAIEGGSKIFYYSLGVGGPWLDIKPSSRSDYRNHRFMYKLQLEAFTRDDNTGENDLIARFLREFLPAIDGKLKKI